MSSNLLPICGVTGAHVTGSDGISFSLIKTDIVSVAIIFCGIFSSIFFSRVGLGIYHDFSSVFFQLF